MILHYYGEKISSTDLQQLSNIDFNNTSVQTKLEEKLYLLAKERVLD